MEAPSYFRGKRPVILLGTAILLGLYAARVYNFLLFHFLAEFFSIVVACSIFLVAWNARRSQENHYFLFVGIGYLFSGALDLLHMLTYKGMGVFPGYDANLATQLWVGARYLQAVSLLAAPRFASRALDPGVALAGFASAAFLVVASVFSGVFPDCYLEGIGLTPFKIYSEYAICAILLASIFHLNARRAFFERDVVRTMALSIVIAIGSEFLFTMYRDVYGLYNLLGHYLKIVSFFFVYRAVIGIDLARRLELSRRLQREVEERKRAEEKLRAAKEGLEQSVAGRTAELSEANARLERELLERRRTDEMRTLLLDLNQLARSVGGVHEFLTSLASFLKDRFRLESVGIRYRSGDDYPYLETLGFPREFVEAEMNLCPASGSACGEKDGGEGRWECLCGAVVGGRWDSSLPFFTSYGTFWTNAASDLVAVSDAARSITTRGRCIEEGYESIALVPLRFANATFGLLQLNDRRRGLFEPHVLDQLERLAEDVAGILSRLLTREALEESEERFRSLVKSSSVGMFIVLNGRVVYQNPEQKRLFGPMPEGFALGEFRDFHPEDAAKFGKLCAAVSGEGRGAQEMDLRFFPYGKAADGVDMRWVHIHTIPMEYGGEQAVLVSMADITRLKEMEYQFLVREKMASLGYVAAGIAHEIRNPLSGINIHLSALERIHEDADDLGAEAREQVEGIVRQIQAASDRIESVIRKVMDFSRPSAVRTDEADLHLAVENAIDFTATYLRRERITLDRSRLCELPACPADPPLITQVVMNLIVNAAQAMECAEGPKVIGISSFVEADRIVICVSDTGPGIPPEIRDRIFDPFYTTRKDGYGIGLSFCRRVISDHGGTLTAESGGSGGAEFRIRLPIRAEKAGV